MATTKRGGGGAGGDRPRLRSSHEGLLKTPGEKPRTKKAPSRAPRAGGERAAAKRAFSAGTAPPSLPRPDRSRLRKTKATGGQASGAVASDSARALATTIAVAALDKKAVGLQILDVAGKVDYADFLVIMTGRSDRHVQSLAQGIEEELRKKGSRPIAVEGLPHANWVLMDFGDVVVHVFQDEARSLYDIEGLWMDARRMPLPAGAPPNE